MTVHSSTKMGAATGGTEEAIRRIGLIGYPVEHSLSPAMHNAAFGALGLPYRYELLPTPPGDFERRVRECVAEGFAGWNVTVPHKERMLPLLDWISEEVRAMGACNTVRVDEGKLLGYNTDHAGFMAGLQEAGGVVPGGRALLLGAGGVARSVAWALGRAGHPVVVLSRRPQQAEELAEALGAHLPEPLEHGLLEAATLERALESAALLVNCTPVGMWPHEAETPLPHAVRLPERLLVYDLIYKPRRTRLLKAAAEAGCRTQDGLAMLVHQGAACFRVWTGREAPVGVMREAVEEEDVTRKT